MAGAILEVAAEGRAGGKSAERADEDSPAWAAGQRESRGGPHWLAALRPCVIGSTMG
jgi:hypothetical protein